MASTLLALRACVIVTALATCVYAATFYNTGDCPDGHMAGDVWSVNYQCLQCFCDQAGHGCSGCGAVAPFPGCNIVTNRTAPYPDCCPRMVCPVLG